ncbi:MAG: glucosaminidase domain-containing protein [Gammaproteobacteria bacterium]|nr:glucosaminidase domain-containing protein [Gammaproteobacteria bacterium]
MTASITDFSHFQALRAGAERDDPAAIREAAGQFEALFVQTLLKNMRAASLAEPVFGASDQHDMYQEMLDKQLALEMTNGKGIGLADLLVRQLGGSVTDVPAAVKSHGVAIPQSPYPLKVRPQWSGADDFVKDIWPHAQRTAERLDVAPEAIVAQAALETGWGQRVMRRGDGVSSNNLFGIKAGSSWNGDRISRLTLEYRDGIAARQVEEFRSYPSLAATFDDYATVLADKSRYRDVIGKGDDIGGFASALQDAGYATDPAYAEKVMRVAGSDTLRDALAGLKIQNDAPINRELPAGAR